MKTLFVPFLLVLLLRIAVAAPSSDRVDGVLLVSLYSLISNPNAYENDPLRLGGYWITGDELSLLCPQKVSASPRDCVVLKFTTGARVDAALGGRAVRIDGRFIAPSGDDWTIYSGTVVATEIVPALEIRNENHSP